MILPTGWAEAKIADVTDINPKHPSDTDRNLLVSFVPMPAVDESSGSITASIDRPLSEIWTGYTHFSDGDVIFAKITPCMENGKAAVAAGMSNGLACGSTEFFVLRPNRAADSTYIWRYVRQLSFRAEAEQNMSGAVGQRRVPRSYLESRSIPLPPLAEQRRIVAKLDALTARLARARAELDRTACLIRTLRGPVVRKEMRELVLAHGDVAAREHFTWASGKFLPTKAQRGGEIPVYGGNGVNGWHDEANVESRTIVVGRVGAQCGNVHITEGRAWITDNAIFARCVSEAIDLNFSLYAFRDAELIQQAAGTGQPYVNQEALNSVRLPNVDADAQRASAMRMTAAFARADRLEAEAARARALLDRLESAILAKAFRGELVPQDPADEPAGVLLDRIRAERAAAPKAKRGRAAKAA